MGASRELSEFAGVVFVSNGDVGLGTTTPESKLHILDANAALTLTDTDELGNTSISFNSSTTETARILVASQSGATFMRTDVGGVERTRIDSSGSLLIGGTARSNLEKVNVTHDGASQEGIIVVNTNTSAGTHTAIGFRRPSATTVGNITTTLSATAYVTSSDYRLKENIQPMNGALAKVTELKPCTYKWKVDGSDGQGFIAHELQAVCPDAVSGEKDAVNEDGSIKPQGIDTSFLVATLTAAIQEQQAMIEELKAKVAALEAK